LGCLQVTRRSTWYWWASDSGLPPEN
jgi:hypothetical protein